MINYGLKTITILLLFLISLQGLGSAEISDTSTSLDYILLTGFEPFYIYDVNPSQEIVEYLNGTMVENMSIVGAVFPVNFSLSMSQMIDAIELYDPLLVISLGLNGGARMFQIENIGLNFRKRPRSDPLWFLPERLDEMGPFFLKSSIPTKQIVSSLRDDGFAARLSYHAGTYVCNSVFYQTLRYIDVQEKEIPMGFIHLPPLDFQEPYGLNVTVMIDAVSSLISIVLDN